MTETSSDSGRRRLGRYETLFRIGGGGMADVFAARALGEAGFEKLVALKRMLPRLADDERFIAMFLDEGRLAANIVSPHVVQTLDLGRADDGSLYLVMDLVRGVALDRLLHHVRRGEQLVPLPIAIELVAQAARGLQDAHEARTARGEPLRIVHRDVTPHNILVGTDGSVRITDFGVARAVRRLSTTDAGELKGKLGYFAPEQITMSRIDHRVDIFALGITAWETIAGERLFAADNPVAQIEAIRTMPIPPLHEVRPEVPERVSEVVASALERDRERRLSSAGELSERLRAAAKSSVGLAEASEIGSFVRAHAGRALIELEDRLRGALDEPAPASTAPDADEAPEPARATQPTPVGTTMPRVGSRRVLAWALAALAVAAIAGIGLAWWLPAEPEPGAAPPPSPAAAPASEPEADADDEAERAGARGADAPQEPAAEGAPGSIHAEDEPETTDADPPERADEASRARARRRAARRRARASGGSGSEDTGGSTEAQGSSASKAEGSSAAPPVLGMDEFERDLSPREAQ